MSDGWSKLNNQQLGRYGEYFAKMEFTKAGFDVYTSEVDDKGIDFVVRKNEKEYFDVQVKSARNIPYIFRYINKLNPRKNLLFCLVFFKNNEHPVLLLIPSINWKEVRYNIRSHNTDIEDLKLEYRFDSKVKEL